MAEHNVDNSNIDRSEFEMRQRTIDRAPFRNLKIDDSRILNTLEGRRKCELCCKSRKFFCYTCCVPVIDNSYFPRVKIYRVKRNKSAQTVSVEALFTNRKSSSLANRTEVFPIKRAIFIDSTWQQTKAIYKDQRLRELRCVILKSRISQFWRYQKKSPRWYLATIEAIHQFLVELHTCAYTEGYPDIHSSVLNGKQSSVVNSKKTEECAEITQKYHGEYDNLLYFFKYMYDKIHSIYDHDQLQAYKRPLA
ncbi:DTW domain-containing protein 1 isoform X2 [Camponotus floridanus]|uniref:DTW domain-containing protein 1 isoform X2 n=1 Tax=Camponotus floridanus TaxID=104421 RepID=UPI00059BE3BF|nr:DTW domain-containing protein 1 isoform X2 [Camponotus floridanus]